MYTKSIFAIQLTQLGFCNTILKMLIRGLCYFYSHNKNKFELTFFQFLWQAMYHRISKVEIYLPTVLVSTRSRAWGEDGWHSTGMGEYRSNTQHTACLLPPSSRVPAHHPSVRTTNSRLTELQIHFKLFVPGMWRFMSYLFISQYSLDFYWIHCLMLTYLLRQMTAEISCR